MKSLIQYDTTSISKKSINQLQLDTKHNISSPSYKRPSKDLFSTSNIDNVQGEKKLQTVLSKEIIHQNSEKRRNEKSVRLSYNFLL